MCNCVCTVAISTKHNYFCNLFLFRPQIQTDPEEQPKLPNKLVVDNSAVSSCSSNN